MKNLGLITNSGFSSVNSITALERRRQQRNIINDAMARLLLQDKCAFSPPPRAAASLQMKNTPSLAVKDMLAVVAKKRLPRR